MLALRGCVVSLQSGEVSWESGRSDRLSQRERDLLAFLAARPGEVVSRDVLYREVWSHHRAVVSRAVDNCVRRLRTRIEQSPSEPRHIQTVHGQGYRFVPLSPSSSGAGAPELLGRSEELSAVGERLRRGALVSLVGPPGIGKTTIARAWAASGDGRPVVLCALSGTDSAQGLARAVAHACALQLSEAPERLGAQLSRSGDLVLVLDGIEHLLPEAGALLAAWRAAAPRLSVLVTSRHRLGVAGEQVLWIRRLPSAAARQLLLRGRSVPAAEAEHVDAILERLEGVPLAIELFAARVGLMSLRALARRLADAPPGVILQRTGLRRAVAEAWALLAPWEQAALRQLSVFAGGFTAEAAEAVADLSAWPSAPPVLDVLLSLRDRSFLWASEPVAAPGTLRMHLFDMVRAFAAEGGAPEGAVARHARWAGSFAARWPLDPDVPDDLLALAELDNLLAAAKGRGPDAERAALMAMEVLRMSGAIHELVHRGAATLARLSADDPSWPQVSWTLSAGLVRSGELAAARERLDGALQAAAPDSPALPYLRMSLATLARVDGRRADGEAHVAAALPLLAAPGCPPHLVTIAMEQRALLLVRRDPPAAEALYRRALAIARQHGAAFMQASLCENLAALLYRLHRLDEAAALLHRALDGFRELGMTLREGTALTSLGQAQARAGDRDEALRSFQQALALHQRSGHQLFACKTMCALAPLSPPPEAALLLADALLLAEQSGSLLLRSECHAARARLAQRQGRGREARAELEEAIRLSAFMSDRVNRYASLRDEFSKI